jgi:hypothetical protein
MDTKFSHSTRTRPMPLPSAEITAHDRCYLRQSDLICSRREATPAFFSDAGLSRRGSSAMRGAMELAVQRGAEKGRLSFSMRSPRRVNVLMRLRGAIQP